MDAGTTPKLDNAPIRKRLIGFGFDYLAISAYIVFLLLLTLGLFRLLGSSPQNSQLFENPIIADLISFVTLILPVILYFSFWESSAQKATWGKQWVGIQVVSLSGGRLSLSQALARSLIKFLPWQIAHTSLFNIEGWPMAPENPSSIVMVGLILVWVLVGLYLVSIWASPNRQTPYDWISGAYVIENIH